MAISRALARAVAKAVATWAALGALLAAGGCASSPAGAAAPRPAPAPPRIARETQSPRAGDPAEEITPEELASIPEPVPALAEARPAGSASPTTSAPGGEGTPQAAESRPRAGVSSNGGDSSAGTGWTWRVQIFASEDLQLADRKAKEAAERLRVRSHIEFQTPYYKVRLGDFATEEEAQDLRERAIQAGYPGAFRTRCAPDTTRYND